MGLNDNKYCKLTVHRVSPRKAAVETRPRRQTVGHQAETTFPGFGVGGSQSCGETEDESASEDDAAVVVTRRRAYTSTAANKDDGCVEMRAGRLLNPLSRLTLRTTETNMDIPRMTYTPPEKRVSAFDIPLNDDTDMDDPPILDQRVDEDLYSSFLDIDTDENDQERPTMDDPQKFFGASSSRVDFSASSSRVDFSASSSSVTSSRVDFGASSSSVADSSQKFFGALGNSRVMNHSRVDAASTPMKFFGADTPPIPAGFTIDMLPSVDTADDYDHVYSPPETPIAMMKAYETDDNEDDESSFYDDDDTSSATSSSFIDINAEINVDDFRKSNVLSRFKESLNRPNPMPYFRTTEKFPKKIGANRPNKSRSSPPPRKVSYESFPRFQDSRVSSQFDSVYQTVPNETALHHDQVLHLAFKNSLGQLVQISGQPRRKTAKNLFSRRIHCESIVDASPFNGCDAIRLIGHTSEGPIRGGDTISLARLDGLVLRIQTLSKKLCFSSKIDHKSKFIVTGVPEGTLVTDTTKFYLRSVYDRSKTVGILNSKKSGTPGCLVMYAHRNKADMSEPIQFFKRLPDDPYRATRGQWY